MRRGVSIYESINIRDLPTPVQTMDPAHTTAIRLRRLQEWLDEA